MKQLKLSDGEKLILLMLSEIHEHLQIKNGVDTKLVQSAIYSGNLWGLKWQLTGVFHDHEAAPEVIEEVVNVLDMWSFIESSYSRFSSDDKRMIEQEAKPFGQYVQFTGFDGNGEAEYISVARFLVDDLERFSSFKGRELNSHLPSLDAHRRMLGVFNRLRPTLTSGLLTATQVVELLKEKLHPERRSTATAAH
jgi:uncharacterized protein YfbU (UPF0304 family)